MKVKYKSVILLMLCASVVGRARADSAFASLDWAHAKFSGPAFPSLSNVGFGGTSSGDGTITQAFGFVAANNDTFSVDNNNTFLLGGEQGITSWGHADSSLQIGPTNFSIADTTSSNLTAISEITGNDLLVSQADRLGAIVDTNGSIDIKIPYTIDLDTTNDPNGFCCYSVASTVYISFPELPITAQYAYGQASHTSSFGENYQHHGILSLDIDGVEPGTYFFDIGVASTAVFVPEPSTLFLLVASLLGLAVGMLIWKRIG